jgi:hypothetical protein
MDESSQAVEQIERIVFEGSEVVLRTSGDGIKNLAAIIAVALKEENKSSGAMHLKSMLRARKELTVYHLPKELAKDFANEVKVYGVTYCIVKNKLGDNDGQLELLVKSEDAAKVNRIMDRIKYASIDIDDTEDVMKDIKAETAAKDGEAQTPPETEPQTEKPQDKAPEGTPKEVPRPEEQEAEMKPENPTPARAEKDPPSGHGSQRSDTSDRTSTTDTPERKSVRKQIEEIKQDFREKREKKNKQRDRPTPDDIIMRRNLEEQRRRDEALRGGAR